MIDYVQPNDDWMLFVWLYRSKFDLISCSSLGGHNAVVHTIPSEAKKNGRTRFEETVIMIADYRP